MVLDENLVLFVSLMVNYHPCALFPLGCSIRRSVDHSYSARQLGATAKQQFRHPIQRAKKMEFKNYIDRMRHDGLTCPKSTFYQSGTRPTTGMCSGGEASWIVVGEQDKVVIDGVEYIVEPMDDDGKASAWQAAFQDSFISANGIGHDDLLFFVRPDESYPTQDQVLLRRKTGDMPRLDTLVDWKSTFWLNVVVQLPCRLSVSVCERIVGDADAQGKRKTIMKAVKRVSRTVYAAPFRSNMQVKEMTHELSFPLVYYSINNFEDADLHLTIGPNEWLCVELAAIFTHAKDEDVWYDLPGGQPQHLNDAIQPFPQPKSAAKTVLFQGAVAYSALREVYDAKKSNQASMQMGGRRNVIAQTLTSFFRATPSPSESRHEFLMMRGPKGRGQCQVRVEEAGLGNLRASLTFLNLPFGAVSSSLFE